jgi:uncharacterized membrane protein (UPF0127 family)
MFASYKKVSRGMCLVLNKDKFVNLHMLFCFYNYGILFVNSKFQVVDKVVLKPWCLKYVSKKPCKYVIESLPKTFNKIKINDIIKIKKS